MNTPLWAKTSLFYHIYPLGLLGAPAINHFDQPPDHRLPLLAPWLDHIIDLGASALYIGPLFESAFHGYDTRDYFKIDRRLGTNEDMKIFCQMAHEKGLRIILDGVFNHCGRAFWAFQDIQKNGSSSAYVDWFQGLSFSGRNSSGDPFTYQTWNGHESLVKYNLSNPEMRNHLFEAVRYWMNEWNIDGLRLDAADCVSIDFMKDLRKITSEINPDFWLMGEIVHGDYRQWLQQDLLHSVTNYECYKGFYSSFNDENFFEIAYSLNRQFGEQGIYRNNWLYNFVDNHDVNRIASQLKQKNNIYLIYALLLTIPGIPSIYYGSEWGISGLKNNHSDQNLRPAIHLSEFQQNAPEPELLKFIQKLAKLRKTISTLTFGAYQQALVNSKQFGFWRITENQKALVLINMDDQPYQLTNLPVSQSDSWYEPLDSFVTSVQFSDQTISLLIPAHSFRMLVFEQKKLVTTKSGLRK